MLFPKTIPKLFVGCIIFFLFQNFLSAETIVEQGSSKMFHFGPSGKLVYFKNSKGDRLPDFSYVGYHSGEKAIPNVPVRLTINPVKGDNTRHIQDALDKIGTLTPDKNGHRGALLLKRGTYRVEGVLDIRQSGIVLRGEGDGPKDTIIVAAGHDHPRYKRTLITVGNSGKVILDKESRRNITNDYVPIGAHSFNVESASGYSIGDRIIVYRPATAKWISLIGCDRLAPRWQEEKGKKVNITKQWKPKNFNLNFERIITRIEGNLITIDAPIVQPMDKKYGGGAIFHYQVTGRVEEVGIEDLRIMSEFSSPVAGNPYGDPRKTRNAEEHGWNAIKLNRNTENTWVRNVSSKYFGWSMVSASGKRATVQDCVCLGQASIIKGGRRYPFMINGQLNLMQRCLSFEGRHEFVNQACTMGPNVFVDCIGLDSRSGAGPHHRYAVGNLYDNVKSEAYMESRFRGNSGTGHGWAGAQTCFYNCIANAFKVQAPPEGISWVIGCGKLYSKSIRVSPPSLYYQQVQDRLGQVALERLATEEQRKYLGQYLWEKKRLEKACGIKIK